MDTSIAKTREAYDQLVADGGFRAVYIADVSRLAKLPIAQIKAIIHDLWKQGKVVLSIGDWSMAKTYQRAGAITIGGRKNLQVRFL